MKRLLIILTLLASSTATMLAQHTIHGIIDDSQGHPIPYATIQLLHKDSSLVAGTISDDNGTYSISAAKGNYILQVSYIGYCTRTLPVELPLASPMPSIHLQEEASTIKEVEVKAKKQLIERHMDKLVLNVSESPLAAGSNGNELLKKAPGVNIDKDGNVTVNGKGVEVYIDGRPSYLSGQQLKAMLEGTDGSTIEKIEIISNPSAKYDASGSGGIINIKTKRNMMQGLNGTLSAAFGGMYFKDAPTPMCIQEYASLNLNYRTQKTYTNLQLTQVYGSQSPRMEFSSKSADFERYSSTEYTVGFQYYNLRASNDWYIDKKNTLGFIVHVPLMIVNQSSEPGFNTGGYVLQAADTIEWSKDSTTTTMFSPQHSCNLNYTHIFSDSLEREITLNADYNRYSTHQGNYQNTIYKRLSEDGTWQQSSMGLDINTRQIVDIYSIKGDFQTKFWNTGMLEAGAKYALSNTFNTMTTDSIYNDMITSVPAEFDYSEHIAAGYITAGKQFGEHWSVKLGLRGEYTFSKGNWKTADTITSKSYFNVFPTFFTSYTSKPLGKLSQPISTSISYTRRIKRPSYYNLNPFKRYLNAHSYTMGNTELSPEFNNDVEVNFSYSQYLSMTFNFSHTQDMHSTRGEILPNGDSRLMWYNFGTCTTHGGNLSLTELPLVPKFVTIDDGNRMRQGAWLALTLNGGYYYFINRAYKEMGEYESRCHWGYGSATLNAYLPKDWVISVDGRYNAPVTMGYSHNSGQWYMGAGIRKMYMKKGLIFNLQVQDILRSDTYIDETRGMGEGQEQWYSQKARMQKVMLSLTWMFGRQQYHKQRNVGNVDETSRLGGGGSGAKL